MWFITMVFKNLARRSLRSFLTISAIAIAIGAFLSLVGVAMGFETSFLQIYEGVGVDLIVVRAGGNQRLNSSLDETLEDKIRPIAGVRDVLPGLADMVAFPKYDLFTVLVQGWRPETAAFDHLQIKEGRTLTRADKRGVLLGSILAQNMEKKLGDTLDLLEDEPFTVVGIYETFNVFENGAMVVPLAEMQRIMGRQGKVTGFSIILAPDAQARIGDIRQEIQKLAPGLKVMPTREHVDSLTEIQLAKAMAWLTSMIALLIGGFGIMNTMVMSVHERTREIGTLRAVGWRKGRVFKLILLEAVVLSIVGAVAGAVFALVLLQVLTHVPTVSGLIDGRIRPLLLLEGFGIAIGVGLLGGILPAQRAARMLPVAALRYE